jgi:hypothetical protein
MDLLEGDPTSLRDIGQRKSQTKPTRGQTAADV